MLNIHLDTSNTYSAFIAEISLFVKCIYFVKKKSLCLD